MAVPDISAEIAAFRDAAYGEEVRSALISLANKLRGVITSELNDMSTTWNSYKDTMDDDWDSYKDDVDESLVYINDNFINVVKVTADNWSTVLPDANNALGNTIYLFQMSITDGPYPNIAHMPHEYYGIGFRYTMCTLKVFTPTSYSTHSRQNTGTIQEFYNGVDTFIRYAENDNTPPTQWSAWTLKDTHALAPYAYSTGIYGGAWYYITNNVVFNTNGHIRYDGTISTNNTFKTSDYIECYGYTHLLVHVGAKRNAVDDYWIVFFDEEKHALPYGFAKLVSALDITLPLSFTIRVPKKAKYFRYSDNVSRLYVTIIGILRVPQNTDQELIYPSLLDTCRTDLLSTMTFIPGYYAHQTDGSLIQAADWCISDKPIKLYGGSIIAIDNIPSTGVFITYKDSSGVFRNFAKTKGSNPYYQVFPYDTEVYFGINMAYLTAFHDDIPRIYYGMPVDNNTLVYSNYEKDLCYLDKIYANIDDEDLSTYDSNMFVYEIKTISNKDRVLTKLEVYSESSRSATLAIGMVDQRGWFVTTSTHSISLSTGINKIHFTERILVPAGYTYAINVLSTDKYYTNTSNYARWGKFTSLSNITVSDFSYKPLIQAAFESLTQIDNLQITSKELSSRFDTFNMYFSGDTIVSDSNGVKYRLSLDSNLNLIKTKVIPDKFAVFGNSLCWHGIREAVNWWSEWGMAASKEQYDYCHQLLSYFNSLNNNNTQGIFKNMASWETASNRSSVLSSFDQWLSNDLDLIIVQLSENASDTTTLESDFETLLTYLHNAVPNAQLMLLGNAFGSQEKTAMARRAASKHNTKFVNLLSSFSDPSFKAGMGATIYYPDGQSTYTVTNSGVAGHPGDAGMKMIAQEALRVLLSDSSIVL